MKKAISIMAACLLCMALTAPAFASNYDFESGADTLTGFGRPTSNSDPVSPDTMSENVRRNKDAAHLPPPYFYGSGDIPTGPSSLYHDDLPGGMFIGNSNISGNYDVITGISALPPAPGLESSTPIIAVNTSPLYYADGSIGTIHIARTNQTIKVYHGEEQENFKIGAGHFAMTSAWDGNVGLCAHNRGSWPHFAFVKDLKTGDKITYTTLYGTRTYEVFRKEQISEYDHTWLGWSAENLLTLITCIENVPELRWAAQLREVL